MRDAVHFGLVNIQGLFLLVCCARALNAADRYNDDGNLLILIEVAVSLTSAIPTVHRASNSLASWASLLRRRLVLRAFKRRLETLNMMEPSASNKYYQNFVVHNDRFWIFFLKNK